MERDDSEVDDAGNTAAQFQGSGKPTGFENVKNNIADKLHDVAVVIAEKSVGQGAQSGIAQCGKKASEWLNHSAEYVRQFDYERADASFREYLGQSPGRSLMIAGGVGLIIGAILRRR